MREIIYVQAGTTANYVGTHFWNEQDHYATLEAEGDEEERIDHAKSFSIREDPGTVRLCSPRYRDRAVIRICFLQRSNSLRPRLLLFERKGIGQVTLERSWRLI
jgi:Misato Segment II tubulin-like domain